MTDAVEVLRIDSLEDERLDAYVRLTERELRCVLEPQKGIFIAESAKVIERAVRAGYEPVSFLLGERWLDQMMPLFDQLVVREGAGPVPVFVASMELMEQLTGFNVTRGALAAFRRPRQIPVDEFLGGVVEAAGERPVQVSLGTEHYPTRDYGAFALPAGVYTSLRVTLGAGEGHNWWCVIFPPLCAQAAGLSEQTVQALSDDDVRLVTESDGGYVVRFRLLELWDALVQRLS